VLQENLRHGVNAVALNAMVTRQRGRASRVSEVARVHRAEIQNVF
jgi:hypothetical protein